MSTRITIDYGKEWHLYRECQENQEDRLWLEVDALEDFELSIQYTIGGPSRVRLALPRVVLEAIQETLNRTPLEELARVQGGGEE